MEKLAQTRYPIHDLLQRRWSPRAFSDKPLIDKSSAGSLKLLAGRLLREMISPGVLLSPPKMIRRPFNNCSTA